jgi:hypothetical protein
MGETLIEHLKSFLAGNFFKLDTDVDVLIDEAKCVTPTFSELEMESISESASQLKFESGNTINESGLVMISKDWLPSDRILERDLLQVAVTDSIKLFESITSSSLDVVLADSQSVKEEESEVDRRSTAEGPRAERLRRYARPRSCCIADLGDGITSRVPKDKIDECEDVIS